MVVEVPMTTKQSEIILAPRSRPLETQQTFSQTHSVMIQNKPKIFSQSFVVGSKPEPVTQRTQMNVQQRGSLKGMKMEVEIEERSKTATAEITRQQEVLQRQQVSVIFYLNRT